MLLNKKDKIYIHNKQVKQIWHQNKIIYNYELELPYVPEGKNPFYVLTWEQIQQITKAGYARKYFTLGQEVLINCGEYGNIIFKLVGFERNQLVLFTKTAVCKRKWKEKIPQNYLDNLEYSNESQVPIFYGSRFCALSNTIDDIVTCMPPEIQNVLKENEYYHSDSCGSFMPIYKKAIAPSLQDFFYQRKLIKNWGKPNQTAEYDLGSYSDLYEWFYYNEYWKFADYCFTRDLTKPPSEGISSIVPLGFKQGVGSSNQSLADTFTGLISGTDPREAYHSVAFIMTIG